MTVDIQASVVKYFWKHFFLQFNGNNTKKGTMRKSMKLCAIKWETKWFIWSKIWIYSCSAHPGFSFSNARLVQDLPYFNAYSLEVIVFVRQIIAQNHKVFLSVTFSVTSVVPFGKKLCNILQPCIFDVGTGRAWIQIQTKK